MFLNCKAFYRYCRKFKYVAFSYFLATLSTVAEIRANDLEDRETDLNKPLRIELLNFTTSVLTLRIEK